MRSLSTWIVDPRSTSVLPTLLRAEVVIRGETTYVLAEQTRAVDPARLSGSAGFLTYDEMQRVDALLSLMLDLR